MREGIMKKHLANIITSTRIIASTILITFSSITGTFLLVYTYCGFSDFADGVVARKLGTSSVLGALLDTLGDIITYIAMVKILIFQGSVPLWALFWFGITLLGFLTSAMIAKKKHGKFYFVHSLFGKILGLCIFLLPFLMKLINNSVSLSIVCTISSIASIESIIIQLKSKTAVHNSYSTKNLEAQ
jgi:CDP-diacylglycerol--glycerol-3-phosphate 3-phosphatidyltransferase